MLELLLRRESPAPSPCPCIRRNGNRWGRILWRACPIVPADAYTHNPIYLGLFLVYTGIGLVVRSPWILILMLPLALMIRYGVVAREEA
jgi:protein-S-isoprenylcysteine O-methyltransferase Ste14